MVGAISTSLLPLQFASGTGYGNKPANPAAAPPGIMTAGTQQANTTGTPSANSTAGAAPPRICSSPPTPKP
ncbi:MAG: hypothetical protein ACJ72J_09800 [Nitrososphaeraceae archaeon]